MGLLEHKVPFGLCVGRARAPREGLGVEVCPILEGAPGKKVTLYLAVGEFDTGLAIRVCDAMGQERDSKQPPERLHPGVDFRRRSAPAGDNYAGVVDHHPLAGPGVDRRYVKVVLRVPRLWWPSVAPWRESPPRTPVCPQW